MGAEIVIAAYRPRPGCAAALEALVRRHLPLLRSRGLATARPPIVMRSRVDGTILEVFEWAGADASSRAHDDPEVAALWGARMDVAELPALGDLAEAGRRFPHFEPV